MKTLNNYIGEALIKKNTKVRTDLVTVEIDRDKIESIFTKNNDENLNKIIKFASDMKFPPYLITNKFRRENNEISSLEIEILLFFSKDKTAEDYFNLDIPMRKKDYTFIEIAHFSEENFIFYFMKYDKYNKIDRTFSSLEEGLKTIKDDANKFFSDL